MKGHDWALVATTAGWVFFMLLLAAGVANLILVHPVPAMAYGVVALPYLPPLRRWAHHALGWGLHPVARGVLAVAIVMFTLGVSDLGDVIDQAVGGTQADPVV